MATLPNSNLSVGQTTVSLYTDVAYAGLIADLMFSNMKVGAYNQSDVITPGLVMDKLSDGSVGLHSVVTATGATLTSLGVAGIFIKDALSDHAPTPSYMPANFAPSAMALSIMDRGKIWAQVTAAGTCTFEGAVKYANDGTVSDTGANTLLHAVFKSVVQTNNDGSRIVMVELHSPSGA